jgi:hypothetical protein
VDEAERADWMRERGYDSGTRRGEVVLTLNFDITAEEGLETWLALCKAAKGTTWPPGTVVQVKDPVKPQPGRAKKQTP